MRRILVPLDGSDLAASILPDAVRLAGDGGEILIIRDATLSMSSASLGTEHHDIAIEASDSYLQGMAHQLCSTGMATEYQTFVMGGAAEAIDQAVAMYRPDMVACATHGRSPIGRLLHGSIAWRAVAHSTVPILLRHAEDEPASAGSEAPRHILVPLDGSEYAEQALPLARQLAAEWNARLSLVEVIPDLEMAHSAPRFGLLTAENLQTAIHHGHDYLKELQGTHGSDLKAHVLLGGVVQSLTACIKEWGVTDVVMTTHGRTGLPRMLLGSVADGLLQHIHVPVILIPSLAVFAARSSARASVA